MLFRIPLLSYNPSYGSFPPEGVDSPQVKKVLLGLRHRLPMGGVPLLITGGGRKSLFGVVLALFVLNLSLHIASTPLCVAVPSPRQALLVEKKRAYSFLLLPLIHSRPDRTTHGSSPAAFSGKNRVFFFQGDPPDVLNSLGRDLSARWFFSLEEIRASR